jgi:Holliday junction resolvase
MYKRTDANQKEIVEALRTAGASVFVVSSVGAGLPDLLVGYRGNNFLLEVKNLAGRGERLTPRELEFMDTWRGHVAIVRSPEEALEACGGNNAE